ncbi:MAG: ATP-binding protein [Candidatus Cloacimonetes bacterium]|nr:ATP-binding protein [Candidatus Cloacimonadota bacterium]
MKHIRKQRSRSNHNSGSAGTKEKTPANINEADIAKNAIIANISHEIRTPMNAIMGFAQMLQSTSLDAKQADYVEVIMDSGKKLLILINNLLDLSNLQLGKTTLHPTEFDLDSTIKKVWNHFRPLIAAKNLKPVLECPEHLPIIRADSEKVERVLSFILSNALKFTLKGQICLRVKLEQQSDSKSMLSFEVEDTGCGIEKDKLEYIFDAFEQADNSVTRLYQGMGLGLSLSSKLVELLGGDIGATSTFGEGSCFFFNVPVDTY